MRHRLSHGAKADWAALHLDPAFGQFLDWQRLFGDQRQQLRAVGFFQQRRDTGMIARLAGGDGIAFRGGRDDLAAGRGQDQLNGTEQWRAGHGKI